MTDMTQDISVIICTYTEDRWDDLVAAVESVQQQTLSPLEVIIVVDHNPALLERVRTCLSDVVVIENKELPGGSGGRTSGLAVAKGRKIAYLDDDETAEPDWLVRLSRWCDEPNVLGAGGRVEPEWINGRPSWFPEEFYWVIGCTFRGMPQTTAPVRNLFAGCMCIRREVFKAVGGFRNEVGHKGSVPFGCDETELCIRANQRFPKGMFIYEPRSVVHAKVPASRAQWRYFCKRCYAEGRSKARVSRLVGAKDGLASERKHAFRTLPQGVLRGIGDAVFRRDLTGLARAVAIVAGLAVTVTGYILETIHQLFTRRKPAGV